MTKRRRQQARARRPQARTFAASNETLKGKSESAPTGSNENLVKVASTAVVLLALAVFAFAVAMRLHNAAAVGGQSASRATLSGKPIDGIRCGEEMTAYHIHTYLAILDRGRPVTVPTNVGIVDNYACLYWLHTHDNSGIIHVEAPMAVKPTLGNFFDIWGQPLSRTRVASASADKGDSMRVYINTKAYSGNPRNIRLRDQTSITIEIGPPFERPVLYNWNGF